MSFSVIINENNSIIFKFADYLTRRFGKVAGESTFRQAISSKCNDEAKLLKKRLFPKTNVSKDLDNSKGDHEEQ